MSHNKDYRSPTTPGLQITFENYLIELMCLYCFPKLGPRFWREGNRWNKKFAIEHGKIKKLKTLIDFVDDRIHKQAIINIINKNRIQSMSRTKTLEKIKRQLPKEIKSIEEKNKTIIDSGKKYKKITQENKTFVDSFTSKEKTSRQKILEHEQKKEN